MTSNSSKKWTKARVERAFSEWRALEDHAGQVAEEYNKITGGDADYYRLMPDTWFGNSEFEWEMYGTSEHGYTGKLPMEYLWTSAWKAAAQKEMDRWKQSAQARAIEEQERKEFQRLRAKFEFESGEPDAH